MTPSTPPTVRALVTDARKMFTRSPLSDDELERIATAALGDGCLRCGRPVNEPRQLCPERTPASPFCWAADLRTGELEIQPGLRLRPGDNYPPLKIVKDPYQ